jgi:hypothetical protein
LISLVLSSHTEHLLLELKRLTLLSLVVLVVHLISKELFLRLSFSLLLQSLLFGIFGFLSTLLLFLTTLIIFPLSNEVVLLALVLFKHSSLLGDFGFGSIGRSGTFGLGSFRLGFRSLR